MADKKPSTVLTPDKFQADANAVEMAIQQILLNNVNTITTGVIDAVNDNGTYDVQPTLNYLLQDQSPFKPPMIFNIPASVIRFGNAGIKGKYKKGDAVIVGIVQRDITVLKKNWKKLTNPNSLRRFALPDGIILNGLSNDEPSTYIELTDDAINITAPTIKLNGNVVVNDVPYDEHKHLAGQLQAPNGPVTGNTGGLSS
mgnify:CR=1 FL=1